MSETVRAYFEAFNRGDTPAMLACLSDDVRHHVNEGQVRTGKDTFRDFCTHMSRCYREELTDMGIFEAEGGTVAVRQSALPQASVPAPVNQPLPAPVATEQTAALAMPNENAYGIAVGAAVPFEQTPALWSDLTLKLGPLLFGLSPLVGDESNGEGKRIVVGPIEELAEARSLCQRFERVSIACIPMPYSGTPLDMSR